MGPWGRGGTGSRRRRRPARAPPRRGSGGKVGLGSARGGRGRGGVLRAGGGASSPPAAPAPAPSPSPGLLPLPSLGGEPPSRRHHAPLCRRARGGVGRGVGGEGGDGRAVERPEKVAGSLHPRGSAGFSARPGGGEVFLSWLDLLCPDLASVWGRGRRGWRRRTELGGQVSLGSFGGRSRGERGVRGPRRSFYPGLILRSGPDPSIRARSVPPDDRAAPRNPLRTRPVR